MKLVAAYFMLIQMLKLIILCGHLIQKVHFTKIEIRGSLNNEETFQKERETL